MNTADILVILDGDSKIEIPGDFLARLSGRAREKGLRLETVEPGKRDSPPCTGCLLCMTRPPYRCVYHEAISPLIRKAAGSPVVIYLTPVLFGSFSPTMKNVLDREGLIVRNHETCRQVVIGCGPDATAEERSTFIDIITRHRGKADIVHPDRRENFEVYFTRSPEENAAICEKII